MGAKSAEQIFKDWLDSTRRQVRFTSHYTSAFISCHIDSSFENVWDAWTDPAKLSQWLANVSGDMREGREVAFDVGAPHSITSKITRLEPKKILRFTWYYPGRVVDEIEVRLSQIGNAATIELEQYSTDKSNWWYGAGSGWESALVRLSLMLSGKDPKSIPNDKFDEVFGSLWLTAGSSSTGIGDQL